MRACGFIVSLRDVTALLNIAFLGVIPRRVNFDNFCYLIATLQSVEGLPHAACLEKASEAFERRAGQASDLPHLELRPVLLDALGLQSSKYLRGLCDFGEAADESIWPYS